MTISDIAMVINDVESTIGPHLVPHIAEDLAQARKDLDSIARSGILNELPEQPLISGYRDFSKIHGLAMLGLVLQEQDPQAIMSANREYSSKGVKGNRLPTILTDSCTKACVMCSTDATAQGQTVNYNTMLGANPEIFENFDLMHFGVDGEPLQTSFRLAKGRANFADYLEAIIDKGMRRFVLDTKGIRPNETRTMRVYQQVKQIVQDSAAEWIQRISFNLYSPDVFGKEPEQAIPTLHDELVPVLSHALEFSSKVIININASYSRDVASLTRTFYCLNEVMSQEGFIGIRPHIPRVFYTDDDPADELLHQKFGGVAYQIAASRENGPSEAEVYKYVSEMQKTVQEEDTGINLFYAQRDTGAMVSVSYAPTMNLGRWATTSKQSRRMEVEFFPKPTNRKSGICQSLYLNSFSIRPDGHIHLCAGNDKDLQTMGPIDQSYDEFMHKVSQAHQKNRAYLAQNLDLIVAGRDTKFQCGYHGPTKPARGTR